MPLHLRFSSFLAFSSCARQPSASAARAYTFCNFKCPRPRRIGDRVIAETLCHSLQLNNFAARFACNSTATCCSERPLPDPWCQGRCVARRNQEDIFFGISYFVYIIRRSSFTSHQLARKFHPDTNPDKTAREKFLEIQEAYDVSPFIYQTINPPYPKLTSRS